MLHAFPSHTEESVSDTADNEGVEPTLEMVSVQELKDELRDSERKRGDLIQANMALQNILKTCREEEGRNRLEMVSLKEKLVSVMSSRVSRMEGMKHQTSCQCCYVCLIQAFLFCIGGASSPTPHTSLPPLSPTSTSRHSKGGHSKGVCYL